MTHHVASACRAIRIVTAIVLALTAVLFAAAIAGRTTPIPAGLLLVIVAACWAFWTPVAYETGGGALVVRFRIGRVRYAPVTGADSPTDALSGVIRLFGNGGLFAGSGIYWSRAQGVFRAYVTRLAPQDLVRVEAGGRRIFVSPANPASLKAALLSKDA